VAAAVTDLKDVLKYKNAEVVGRFAGDFGVSHRQAQNLFTQLKKWLWLCALQAHESRGRRQSGHTNMKSLVLFEEAAPIDGIWHTFLLFTKDYADFCSNYLGIFVHHVPRTSAEKQKWARETKEDSSRTRQKLIKRLRPTYEFIYDHLGPEVLKYWCEELPVRYDVTRF
jgi:hypothetical protein